MYRGALCLKCGNKANYDKRKSEGKKRPPRIISDYSEDAVRQRKDYLLKKAYGIGLKEYEAMLAAQNKVCANCSRPPPENKPWLCVDHCHITGKIRGLLCGKCNSAAGFLEDRAEIAFLMCHYLDYWKSHDNEIAPNPVPDTKNNYSQRNTEMFNEENEENEENWDDFKPEETSKDIRQLSELVQTAFKIQQVIKESTEEQVRLKGQLKDLIEEAIPAKMQACGVQEFKTFSGLHIEIKSDVYANVPSISAISDERDEKKREELIARREAGLSILEEKAPTLIKRKIEIVIDKDRLDQVESVKTMLDDMEDPPDWTEGKSVHPQTLSKWIKEVKATGQAFSQEEEWAFGIFPRKVAKITK